MLILLYPSKKILKAHVGNTLRYRETSVFGIEYKRDGVVTGSNRPSITGIKGREFFANVTMKNHLIEKVD